MRDVSSKSRFKSRDRVQLLNTPCSRILGKTIILAVSWPIQCPEKGVCALLYIFARIQQRTMGSRSPWRRSAENLTPTEVLRPPGLDKKMPACTSSSCRVYI